MIISQLFRPSYYEIVSILGKQVGVMHLPPQLKGLVPIDSLLYETKGKPLVVDGKFC